MHAFLGILKTKFHLLLSLFLKEISIPTGDVSGYIGPPGDRQGMSGKFGPSGVTIRECQGVLRADMGFSGYLRG